MEMNTLNGKVGWIIAGVVVVLAVVAFAVYDSQKAVLPAVDMATTTATTTVATPVVHPTPAKPVTAPSSGTITQAPAPAGPDTTQTGSQTVTSDGTILFGAPISVVIPIGKTAVEKASGLRITVKSIATKKATSVSQPEPTVATITVNTGICQNGTCTSREDTAQNIQFSTGQSVNYGGYTLVVKGLTTTSATISVSKSL